MQSRAPWLESAESTDLSDRHRILLLVLIGKSGLTVSCRVLLDSFWLLCVKVAIRDGPRDEWLSGCLLGDDFTLWLVLPKRRCSTCEGGPEGFDEGKSGLNNKSKAMVCLTIWACLFCNQFVLTEGLQWESPSRARSRTTTIHNIYNV